jgi:alkanesulfonate monooxygenase SsuD/methylene tetrahydromethanopterin reductase-like flavin-dependent oxidoreductase (luciferase family)
VGRVRHSRETLAHIDEVLRAHCASIGRDPSEIEHTVGCKITIRQSEAEAERVRLLLERNRTPLKRVKDDLTFRTGTPEQIAARMISYRRIGFHTFIVELPAPYDVETMETLVSVVKPMVGDAAVPF